jgi:hypothetical protein
MMLKGKTKIELTDVHTGEVEVIEEENMVTNALQYFFNPMGLVKNGDPLFSTEYVEYYTTLTGGLLLLNKTLDEDADNVSLPGDVEQTGCAVYNQQNTSDQTLRGSYNATESEVDLDNRKVKYVYDFDTAEGNGTIACVALTHAYGGYSNRGCAVAPTKGSYPYYKSIGSGLLEYTGNNSAIGAYDRTLTYSTYGTGYKWIIKINALTDSVYYFSVNGTKSISIKRYRANLKTISFFDRPGARRTFLDEKEVTLSQAINTQYFSYNYDEETDKLYIVSASSYYVANNGSYVITEIDMSDDDYTVKQYAMTNKTGGNMRIAYERNNMYCYQGYVYFTPYGYSATYYVYRQEIGNSANLQKIETALERQCDPVMARDGRIYFENATSTSQIIYIVNTNDFTMKIPESKSICESTERQYVPVIGYPLTYYLTYGTSSGKFGFRTDYLATINNLSTPVVKTADKTMKVTYTLQEQ